MIETQEQLQRYFLKISYLGSPFFGWQRQAGDVPTVQKVVEDALSMILRKDTEIVGAGRTDTGVHASSYYAHMDISLTQTNLSAKQLTYKLNRVLPPQVAVNDIIPVSPLAHARYSAISRTYQYRICTRKDPFKMELAWHFESPLDILLMQEASELLLQTKDFACFAKSNSQVKTTLCELSNAHWESHDHLLVFEITANRFLRNMVRSIVGTLTEVGMGKTSIDQFREILKSRDRQKAGYSVPGHGLTLTEIEYPPEIWKV